MHLSIIISVVVIMVVFVIFLFYPNIIRLIPIFNNLEVYQQQLSKLYLKNKLIDNETTVSSLCNTLPKYKDFQDNTKNPDIDTILKDYNHINYGQIFYIVSHCTKRINYIKFELRVYSFILIFLSLAFFLLQLGNNVQTVDTIILVAQFLFVAFFAIRLMLEINNIQLNIEKIILTKSSTEGMDRWKKVATIVGIFSGIATIIKVIMWFLKEKII